MFRIGWGSSGIELQGGYVMLAICFSRRRCKHFNGKSNGRHKVEMRDPAVLFTLGGGGTIVIILQ